MKTITTTTLALLTIVGLLAAGCAESETSDGPAPSYLADTWGITTSGFDGWDGTQFVIEDDGTAVATGEGVIHVDGLGSQTMRIEEQVEPQSRGGVTTVYITEAGGAQDEIYLSYDPVLGHLGFGDETIEMGVDLQPDGAFRVWRYRPETDIEETIIDRTDALGSYQYVEAAGGLADDSPYLLLMAFTLGQSPVYEARGILGHGYVDEAGAGTPAACDAFRVFCDCVACYARDGVGCTPCPKLDP